MKPDYRLKSLDSTFTVNAENRFQVRNSKGLVIDFLTGETVSLAPPKEYLSPIPLEGQDWLLLEPPVKAVVIDTQGLPVELFAPDPRLFCLHKYWVSGRDDRNPLKKTKDQRQSLAVALLIAQCLPQLPFSDKFLARLPDELLAQYEGIIAPHIKVHHQEPPSPMM